MSKASKSAYPVPCASMNLVRALDGSWRDTLDAFAASKKWPTSSEPAKLAPLLTQLSAFYNDESHRPFERLPSETLAARLAFSFPRDVPKGAAAVRELVATGALAMPEGRALRVLDLGAGLGATTWGLVSAIDAAGLSGEVEATLVEPDREALDAAVGLVALRKGKAGGTTLKVQPQVQTIERALASTVKGPFDAIVLGQVLSELERDVEGEERALRHAAMLNALVTKHLAPSGSLVVVEPALRERTRHLHHVREALIKVHHATIFAPCLHEGPCPALAHPNDWCHEDLAVDLPEWVVPIARGAGLRYEGLTLSYLVVRNDGLTLRKSLSEAVVAPLRLTSGPLVSKGKVERVVCGWFEEASKGLVAGGARLARLDRDASPSLQPWGDSARGALVEVKPTLLSDVRRLPAESSVEPLSLASAKSDRPEEHHR